MVFVNDHVDREVEMTYAGKVACNQNDKLLGSIQEVWNMSGSFPVFMHLDQNNVDVLTTWQRLR